MFSEALYNHAQSRLTARAELLGERLNEIRAEAGRLNADEVLLFDVALGSLPLTDITDTSGAVLASFARHAAYLRRKVPRVAELPEDMFIHYVACPRINTEPLVNCREPLWELLRERVAGLSEKNIVLETNYWCAERATYQSTDLRTLSALGVLSACFGRCGEESTLLVSALRAVGIPARQMYTPWWAHCDDNHAWVEAWVEDKWQYLGACEPEEVLNRGWFTSAAGRAPLVHSARYSNYVCPNSPLAEVEPALPSGCTWVDNATAAYAPTTKLSVQAQTTDGNPLAHTPVVVEFLNSAQWRPAALLTTDETGCCSVAIGLGTVRVRTSVGEKLAEVVIDTACTSEVTLVPQDLVADGTWHDLDIRAPKDQPAPSCRPTAAELARGRMRTAQATEKRLARVARLQHEAAEAAKELLATRPDLDAQIVHNLMEHAGENYPQIAAFLSAGSEPERLWMLADLAPKDLFDLHADLLECHLAAALAARAASYELMAAQGVTGAQANTLWRSHVLSPRIAFEQLSNWREGFVNDLGADKLSRLVAKPWELWQTLTERSRFSAAENLAKLVGEPLAAWRSGQTADVTRTTLFVALCRSAGLPALLCPETGIPHALYEGRLQSIRSAEEQAAGTHAPAALTRRLRVRLSSEHRLAYGVDWTLARADHQMLSGGQRLYDFVTLDLTDGDNPALLETEVALGTYRLTSITRLPNGSQQATTLTFEVAAESADPGTSNASDGALEVALRTREPQPSEMLSTIHLDEVELIATDGPSFSLVDYVRKHTPAKRALIALLEEAEEPTEHLLNELIDAADDVHAAGFGVVLISTADQPTDDPTLSRCLAALPATQRAWGDFATLHEPLARRVYADPEKLPLTLLVEASETGLICRYATAGYNVGTVRLALRLATACKELASEPNTEA